MAVYELNNGQLLRVARSIDGKLQQQYFSLIGLNKTKQREVRKAAKAQDQKWQESQEKAKAKRVREASTDKKQHGRAWHQSGAPSVSRVSGSGANRGQIFRTRILGQKVGCSQGMGTGDQIPV